MEDSDEVVLWIYYGDNYFRCSFTKSCSEGCTVFMVVEGEGDTIFVKMKKAELDSVGEALVEKVEGEDRTMKEISKKMSELEDEIKNYFSDRTTKKYSNIQMVYIGRVKPGLVVNCTVFDRMLETEMKERKEG